MRIYISGKIGEEVISDATREKFAKAEEPQDREKAKGALKNAIIGFVLIFVLILALKLLMPIMKQWVIDNGGVIS